MGIDVTLDYGGYDDYLQDRINRMNGWVKESEVKEKLRKSAVLKSICNCPDCGKEMKVLSVDGCCDTFTLTALCDCGSKFNYHLIVTPSN